MGLLLLVDLDGVVYRGEDPVPGVAAVLMARAEAGDDVVYVTNNSMHYRADYVTRLAGLGRELRDVGLEVVNTGCAAERMAREGIDGVAAAGNPQAVIAGVDPQMT